MLQANIGISHLENKIRVIKSGISNFGIKINNFWITITYWEQN